MSTAQAEYERKRCSARQAVARLRRDDTVAVPILTGQPAALLTALAERDDWQELTLFSGLLIEPYPILLRPGVRYISGFLGPIERMLIDAGGAIDFLPSDFLGWDRWARSQSPRVVASAVAPMDEHGYFSFALHAGATFDAFLSATRDPERVAIAEVVRDLPHVYGLGEHGAHRVHVSEVDAVVESDRSAFVLPVEAPTEVDRAIAARVESLIPEGATLQFGIGAVPNIVATLLAEGPKGDFGVHTEMFVDGIMRLHGADKITNRKGIHDGFSVATFAAGSAELNRWLHRNPEVRLLPVTQVNDPAIIRRNRRMVSINGALGVDVHGQIMAESIGARQYSGVGGHELFVMGARDSEGGKSIVCLRATATVDGRPVSTIVAQFPAGTPVSTPRQHVDYVVTEYGIAHLGPLTSRERRAALAAIAHPDLRAELD
jgi:acyl-CoA hydrolase